MEGCWCKARKRKTDQYHIIAWKVYCKNKIFSHYYDIVVQTYHVVTCNVLELVITVIDHVIRWKLVLKKVNCYHVKSLYVVITWKTSCYNDKLFM